MSFDLNKFSKYTWLAGAYAFYAVYAKKNVADPFGQMLTDIKAWMTDPLAKIQLKVNSVIMIIAILVFAPVVIKALKLPGWIKVIFNAAAYYIIGDQLASIVNQTTPGVFGATGRPPGSWGGERSAFHQPRNAVSMISNNYGG